GFDSDTIDIFDAQFDFIQKACIPVVKMHLLKAGPGTALFNRLSEEKRLIGNYNIYGENKGFDLELMTNIIPKRMSRQEMFENYSLLLKKIYDWENFFLRLEGFINNINYAPLLNKNSAKEIFLNDFLEKFISSFDNELKSRVEYLIVLTLRRIPVMIYDIVTHILRHQIEVMKLPKLLEDINKIIEYELENGYY
ncbi:MAG: hypothetical protein QG635_182, partial [Bacteroidota bacterium]|nr:hypothetical protein [Bacteroidota bacterium]